jgi:hypothetical protein
MSGLRLLIRAWMVAVVAALLVAPGAHAITAKRAQAVALRTLKPQQLAGPYALFGLPQPLARGAVVAQGGPANGRASQTLPARPLRSRAWLFWLDEAPNAEFQHPSRVLLVDDRDGRVVRDEDDVWWPTVDGRRPAFLATRDAYWSPRYRVRYTDVQGPLPTPRARAAQVDLPAGATQFTGDCIVTIGDRSDPMFTGDFAAIDLFANQHGIRKLDATSVADLTAKVDQLHHGKPPCLDVVVWVSGHGSPATGTTFLHKGQPIHGTPKATVGLNYSTTIHGRHGRPNKLTIRYEQLTSDDLRTLFTAHPDMSFKLVVDSCFSGRWWELGGVGNLRVIVTSSRRDQLSYGAFLTGGTYNTGHQENATLTTTPAQKTNTVDNPGGAGPFTAGVITALDQWTASPQRTDDLGLGVAYAKQHESEFNFADQLGWTVSGGLDYTASRPHASPPAPTPPPVTGGPFSANAVLTYRHISPGNSEVCARVSTSPARPGGLATVVTLGPGVTGGGRQTVALGPDGTALVRVSINAYGGYSTDVTVSDGDIATSSDAITVGPSPGTCPAP